jgi:hypothetical protein
VLSAIVPIIGDRAHHWRKRLPSVITPTIGDGAYCLATVVRVHIGWIFFKVFIYSVLGGNTFD